MPMSRTRTARTHSTANKPPRFLLRARITGIIEWVCPHCGNVCRSRVTPTAGRVRCTGRGCTKVYRVGVQFHGVTRGSGSFTSPEDTVIPKHYYTESERNGALSSVADEFPDEPAAALGDALPAIPFNEHVLLSPHSAVNTLIEDDPLAEHIDSESQDT